MALPQYLSNQQGEEMVPRSAALPITSSFPIQIVLYLVRLRIESYRGVVAASLSAVP